MNNDQIKALMAAIIFAVLSKDSSASVDDDVEAAVDIAQKIGDKFSSTIV